MLKKSFKIITALMAVVCTVIFSLVFYCDLNYPDKVYASDNIGITVGKCTVNPDRSVMSLFGIVPVKDVDVSVAPQRSVVVSGAPFGVMLYSQGVMVVGSNSFVSKNGNADPAKEADIKIGDIIISINGEKMTCIEDVTKQIVNSDGQPLTVEIKRDDIPITTTITPRIGTEDGKYHIGVWVRDSSAGIGTMTFYDPANKTAVGFGHPICDADTGNIVEISNGTAVKAGLYSVRKGAKGNPGELLGTLKINSPLGTVVKNDLSGVYFNCSIQPQGMLMPIAYACEVKCGNAKIYTTVEGQEPQYYDVQIESVDPSRDVKNLVVKMKTSVWACWLVSF